MAVKFTINGVVIEAESAFDAAQLVAAMSTNPVIREEKKTGGRTMRRVGGITLEDMVKSVFDETDRALTKYRVYDIIVRDYAGMFGGQIQLQTISSYMSKMTKEGEIRRVARGMYVKNKITA